LSIRFTEEYGECNAGITAINKKIVVLPNTLDLYLLLTRVSYVPHFTRHCISKGRYATSDLSSTSLMQLRTFPVTTVAPYCKSLHPTLRIRKMPTYKVVHSEYFCAMMTVLQQFIISGRQGLKVVTLHLPRLSDLNLTTHE
jgi:hypothetical protein